MTNLSNMLPNSTALTPNTIVFNTLDYTPVEVLSSNPLTTEIEYLSGHVATVPTSALLDEENFNKQKHNLVNLLQKRLDNIQILSRYYTCYPYLGLQEPHSI